jgi:hypothetical protein
MLSQWDLQSKGYQNFKFLLTRFVFLALKGFYLQPWGLFVCDERY